MATSTPMQLGMIGLGRMGAGLVRRLIADGHHCVGYDVSSDATWFVVSKGDEGQTAPELHVVLNWFNEIKSAASGARARYAPTGLQRVATLVRSIFPAIYAAGAGESQAIAIEPAVRDTLQRYSAALESLDANAVKRVQPSLPAETLAKGAASE